MMVGPGDELEALKKEEEMLEKMRTMVSPDHWPRLYVMLARVRERIRKIESSGKDNTNKTAA
jgi:hypothetical protein